MKNDGPEKSKTMTMEWVEQGEREKIREHAYVMHCGAIWNGV